MASLQSVRVHGHTYWRIVESRRVHGKPRPVPVLYLGKADDLLARLQSPDPVRIHSFSHGAVATLWSPSAVPATLPASGPSPHGRDRPLWGPWPGLTWHDSAPSISGIRWSRFLWKPSRSWSVTSSPPPFLGFRFRWIRCCSTPRTSSRSFVPPMPVFP